MNIFILSYHNNNNNIKCILFEGRIFLFCCCCYFVYFSHFYSPVRSSSISGRRSIRVFVKSARVIISNRKRIQRVFCLLHSALFLIYVSTHFTFFLAANIDLCLKRQYFFFHLVFTSISFFRRRKWNEWMNGKRKQNTNTQRQFIPNSKANIKYCSK